MNKNELIDPGLCSTKAAAEIFGCSGQHLRDLAKAGEIKQTARGKYSLREVAAYMMQANKADMSDLQKAKLKSQQEKARRQTMQNDETAKQLIRVDEVRYFLHGFTSEMIRFVEALKKRTGATLDNETRKKFFRALEAERSEMSGKLQTWAVDALATDQTIEDSVNQ